MYTITSRPPSGAISRWSETSAGASSRSGGSGEGAGDDEGGSAGAGAADRGGRTVGGEWVERQIGRRVACSERALGGAAVAHPAREVTQPRVVRPELCGRAEQPQRARHAFGRHARLSQHTLLQPDSHLEPVTLRAIRLRLRVCRLRRLRVARRVLVAQ
eukprot:2267128-Prymnesium_polylepis.1